MRQPVRLGDVAEVIRGVSFDKNETFDEPRDGCLPVLRAGNIQDELIIDRNLIWVSSYRVSPQQRMRRGDIALAVSSGSASLVGKTAMLDQDWSGSVGAFCAIVRPGKGVSSKYLSFWLRGPQFSSWRAAATTGANIQNLRISALAELKMRLPPLDEQERIAARLSDQMLAARSAGLAACDQADVSEGLLDASLTVEFHGCTPIGTDRSPGTPDVTWQWLPLQSLARLESGHTPSRRHPEWWNGPVPWLALPDIRKLHGKTAYQTAETINDAGLANSSARLLPAGTVCLCRDASIGFVTLLGRPMATSQHFCNWVCDPSRLDPEFLMYAFMASQDALRDLGSGSVLKTIYMPTIRSFHVCAPRLVEQRRIAAALRERLAAAEALTVALAARRAEIEKLPRRLLAATFGEAA